MSVKDFDFSPLKIQPGLSEKRKLKAFSAEIESYGGNVLLTAKKIHSLESSHFRYYFGTKYVYVHNDVLSEFKEQFKPFIDKNTLRYDNLINICIMVKNAGDGFADILKRNLPYMDRYTILDTGSTDNTIAIAKEILAEKRGEIYQEPFINFRDSRNRLLELAGEKCFFNVMIDDTYVLNGNIRTFLDIARGDDTVDSFSITIEDEENLYLSNRITKSSRGLKYVNLIHEIIEPNYSVSVPYSWGYIRDISSEYMRTRTKKRKEQDLVILRQMLENNPTDPRTYFYMAETYLCMEEWKLALDWYTKRAEFNTGYPDEKQKALYFIAVIKHYHLNYPWDECLQAYHECYEFDPRRGEALYFIGLEYYKQNRQNIAKMYIEKAFSLGIPEIQMAVRKDIYNYHIPKTLVELCYLLKDYRLGLKACNRLLNFKPLDKIHQNWYTIFSLLNSVTNKPDKNDYNNRSTIVFVTGGNSEVWQEFVQNDGIIYQENVASLTSLYAVRLFLALENKNICVFTNVEKEVNIDNIEYKPISTLSSFISQYKIEKSYIWNMSNYIPLFTENKISVNYIISEKVKEFSIIPVNKFIENIYSVSEKISEDFTKLFPQLQNVVTTINSEFELF